MKIFFAHLASRFAFSFGSLFWLCAHFFIKLKACAIGKILPTLSVLYIVCVLTVIVIKIKREKEIFSNFIDVRSH